MPNNSNQAALLGLGSFNPAYSTLSPQQLPPQLPHAFPGGAALPQQLGAPTMFPLPPANNPFLEMSTAAAQQQQQQAPRMIGSLPQNVFQVQYLPVKQCWGSGSVIMLLRIRFRILSIYQRIKVISEKILCFIIFRYPNGLIGICLITFIFNGSKNVQD